MKSPKSISILLFVLVISTFAKQAEALQIRQVSGHRAEESFELTESSGPWLIMCASFVGEEAEIQALTLARELRTSLRGNAGLDAFIYRHRFDFSDSLEGIGYDTTEGTRLADGSVIAKRKQMTANNAAALLAVICFRLAITLPSAKRVPSVVSYPIPSSESEKSKR